MIDEFETVEEFLEHHGTKGMRWGVRKETSLGSGSSKPSNKPSSKTITKSVSKPINKKPKKGLSPEQKKKLLAVGVASGVGALFVAGYLMRNRGVKLQSAKATADLGRGIREAQRNLNNLGGVKVSTIRQGFAVGSGGVATPIMRTLVSL